MMEKAAEGYNSRYHAYSVNYCRSTGLPMFSSKNFADVDRNYHLYTISRAKKEKVSVDESHVCGWYRVMHGYVPVYGLKEFSCLKDAAFLKSAYSFVKYNHPDLLTEMLACERSVPVLSSAIDQLISESIASQNHECYVALLNWKNEKKLYSDPVENLRLQ